MTQVSEVVRFKFDPREDFVKQATRALVVLMTRTKQGWRAEEVTVAFVRTEFHGTGYMAVAAAAQRKRRRA